MLNETTDISIRYFSENEGPQTQIVQICISSGCAIKASESGNGEGKHFLIIIFDFVFEVQEEGEPTLVRWLTRSFGTYKQTF